MGIVFLAPLFTFLVTLDWFRVRRAGLAALKEGTVEAQLSWPARALFGLLSLVSFFGALALVTIAAYPTVPGALGLFVLGLGSGWVAITGRVRSTVVRL